MRKALNFDLNTKEYEKYAKRKAPTAYYEIKKFLLNEDFEHRQGSGYVSKENLSDFKIFTIIKNMSEQLYWLRKCVRQIDVTNIGRQYSLIYAVNDAKIR